MGIVLEDFREMKKRTRMRSRLATTTLEDT
jgi:hypothetical protein